MNLITFFILILLHIAKSVCPSCNINRLIHFKGTVLWPITANPKKIKITKLKKNKIKNENKKPKK